MKLALLTASLLLVGGTMTACGGDEVSDDTVSTKDFCAAITKVQEAYGEVNPEEPTEEQVRGVKDAVAALADQGLPEDVSDEARDGLELIADEIADVPDDATAEDLEKAGEDFSDEDDAKSEAFDAYVEDTCADASGDDSPSDGSSE